MTTADEFLRLESLFHELADLPEDERAARLGQLRREDPALHDHLRQLLARDEIGDETDLLGAVQGPRDLEPGDRIGAYRLVRRIGVGGMGLVFEAEQEQPLRRRVALKVVRAELGGRRTHARFDAERATLARLKHPGIAQIHDAGTTPDGRPYFVMELVEGETISAFCDRRRYSTEERIHLFRRVCAAVEHAHRKGILHRDLKPANVLVSDPEPDGLRVKIIDFGIAKLVGPDSDVDPGLTRLGEVVGTPEYMSPEQTRGEDIDTRSDVYSLGVLLYELLTGRVPIDADTFRGASPVQIARIVEEQAVTPPDARLAPPSAEAAAIAALRRTDPVRLRRQLRGDLGSILLMALRKEPERRYGSVQELSLDLERYLGGHPVSARPDSWSYRASRLARRHRAAFAAGALLVTALAGAAVFSTAMYLEADDARRESEAQRTAAEEISGFLEAMLSSIDPQVARGRDVSLLREILERGATDLAGHLGSAPRVRAAIGATIGKSYRAIGLEEEAERHLRASLERLDSLPDADPVQLADVRLALGLVLHELNRFEEAEEQIRRALVEADGPAGSVELRVVARTRLAELLEDVGDYAESEDLFRSALAESEAPEVGIEAHAALLRSFGEHLMNHHRMEEAEPLLRAAVTVRRNAGEDGASLVIPLTTLARWHRWSEDLETAARLTREAVAIARRELPDDHPMLLSAIASQANAEQHRGEVEIAEALYNEALEKQRRLRGDLHSSVATTSNNLASLLRDLGRFEEAEALFADAVAGYTANLGPDHYWTSIARGNRGRVLWELGRFEDAARELAEASRIRELEEAEPWQRAEVDLLWTACRVALGDTDGAREDLARSSALLAERFGDDDPRLEPGKRALALLDRVGN